MAPKISCKCCNQLSESHLMITCSVCKEKYKHSCVDITANEVRTLNSNKGYDWTCLGCRAIGKDLKELKALLIGLQNEIKELRTEQARGNSSDIEFEEIVSEISEREKRRKNVMFFNVPEPDQTKSPAEQAESDKTVIRAIVNVVSPDLSGITVKVHRLGQFVNSRIRPIRITVENEDEVKKILKFAKNLRNNRNYSKVGISSDRTKRQIEHYKKIRQELMERSSAGENIRIKYINGIPRIVPLN